VVFDTGEPRSGAEIISALERLQSQSERFLGILPTTVFFQPQGEKWSPAVHVRHLRKSTVPLVLAFGVLRPLLLVFGRSGRPSGGFAELRDQYRQKLAAGATAGVFAPSKQVLPDDLEAQRSTIMRAWSTTTQALCDRLEDWDEAALDQYGLPHPILRRLTAREMMLFTVYHNAHHLRLVAARIGQPTTRT
jgi:hypothetical protein